MRKILRIIESIEFTEVDEFYEKKDYIKQKYQELDMEAKEIYKWYFYFQLCLLKNPLKELLWTYINNQEENMYLSSDLSREYRLFCEKRKKQKIEESQIDKF